MNIKTPLAIIAGAGPGLGKALVNKLTAEGFHVLALSRTLYPGMENSETVTYQHVDLTDKNHVDEIVAQATNKHGCPEAVIHNTAQLVIKPFLEMQASDFNDTWQSMVQTATNICQATLPSMVEAGKGTIIVTGATASLRGGKNFSAFSSAKFALRGLTQSLAREFQPQGIHVAHVILDGIIDTDKSRSLHNLSPENMMKPEDIADSYWHLIQQPRSSWSHELDLRPFQESF